MKKNVPAGSPTKQKWLNLIIIAYTWPSMILSLRLLPTDRAAYFRFTFPETDEGYIVIDSYDRGSYIKVIPEENKIIGYTTRNSGGVPENFKNYFVIVLEKTPDSWSVWKDGKVCDGKELRMSMLAH